MDIIEKKMEVYATISKYLHDEYHIEYTNIHPYSSLKFDYGFDSYEMTALSVEVSDWYGVDLDDEALLGNLSDVVENIVDKGTKRDI